MIALTSYGSLTAPSGALFNSGLIEARTNDKLLWQPGLTNNNTGSIIAQSGFGSLTASAGTFIDAAGLIESGSRVTLLGQAGLTNTGSVIAQGSFASLTASTGPLSNSGLIKAHTNVTLLGDTGLSNTGSIIAQTGFGLLTATVGTLSNSGLIEAGTSETLLGEAGLSNAGQIIAQGGFGSLTASGGALSNSGLIEAGTSETLLGQAGLSNSGQIIAQGGFGSLTASAGALSNSGLIEASTSETLLGATGLSNSGSVIAQSGNVTLTATSGTLFTSGLVSAAAANAIVALNALNGVLDQTGGSIIAGGSVVMNISGGITLNGLVKDDTGVTLEPGGAITENGTLIADLLTGSAASTVDLLGVTATTNQVAILGNFTSGGSFILRDGINLLIDGVASAPTINILNGVDTISLGNASFITSGVVRPAGAIQGQDLPPNGFRRWAPICMPAASSRPAPASPSATCPARRRAS